MEFHRFQVLPFSGFDWGGQPAYVIEAIRIAEIEYEEVRTSVLKEQQARQSASKQKGSTQGQAEALTRALQRQAAKPRPPRQGRGRK